MFDKKTVRQKLAELNILQLIQFISEEFPANGQPASSQNFKIEVLKTLSHNDLTAAIARMSRINNVFDIAKSLSVVTIVLSGATLIFKNIFGDGLGTALLGAIFIMSILTTGFFDRRKHNTSVFFKELLIRVKEDKIREEK
ncbi:MULTISPECIES: hypothetical protein [Bacillus]|uniref:hypothetical protein n=1 Tax=Bacillus TaxID=1386 RepID=UPI000E752EE6|nr:MULTISPECIES: hypothetical protein [Bacillus]MDR4910613.1 hypothetical protein [Bacillus subtilis]MEC2134672.1 hypothetical protein [Bacillus subtilis]QFY85109.1 hypothetical protein D0819_06620 [Bacillus subtilis]RJS53098.1 hypothetical protein CJ480_15380 [Bacillus subtilis]UEG55633.1 hypothetical protein LK685_12315 [Bacillus sp. BC1-43]